jgi:DNA-binding beta-propeller fold protein YncE
VDTTRATHLRKSTHLVDVARPPRIAASASPRTAARASLHICCAQSNVSLRARPTLHIRPSRRPLPRDKEIMMRIAPSALALCALPLIAAACDGVAPAGDVTAASVDPAALHDVLLVGNSAAGTVTVLDGHSFANLGSVNVTPDLQQRLAAIKGDLIHSIAYSLVTDKQKLKHFEPSNGERFVDDLFVSPDGTRLYVSRSNLGDVAAFDLTSASHPLVWRHDVAGFKADHATLSPDGTRLVVSATAVDKAEVLDAANGSLVTSFGTGHYPHQNDYSADGKHIYNGSIGDVSLPAFFDFLKGFRLLTVVDAQTYAPVRTYWFPAGIRPAVITADEKTMYTQLSYLNGVAKFDLVSGAITTRVEEPLSAFAKATYPTRDDYPHDSAHHGLALSGDGSRLCDAGTIDNTASIITTSDMVVQSTVDVGLIPYWATTSVDGKSCVLSISGDNVVSIVDYASGKLLQKVPVGKFPQRNRVGAVPEGVITLLSRSGG